MVEDNPNMDNHQELMGYFKTKGEKLLFGLMLTLILLYLFAYYLAVKSLIFLKGLSELTILPLLLFLVVFSGLISEKISIILSILIYCILTYQISPKLMKPLFGDFCGLWWVRIIVVALACVYCSWARYIIYSDYASFLYIAVIISSAILLGKMMLNKSDLIQWKGPVPRCHDIIHFDTEMAKKGMEEVRETYNESLKIPRMYRKLVRFLPVFSSGLLFSTICMFFGILFHAFLFYTNLFLILISLWVLNNLSYLIREKSLFDFGAWVKVFLGNLFSWENIPGKDSKRLLRYLWHYHDIGWVKNAEISKSDDGKTIRIIKDKKSAEITIDKEEEKATLKICDGRIHNLKVKNENGKLNIYRGHAPEASIFLSLLSFKTHDPLKQIGGFICILAGILIIAWYIFLGFTVSVSPTFVPFIEMTQCKDFKLFVILLIFFIIGISYLLAVIFQSYFWYILIQRFPHFLTVWSKRDFSMEVDVPRLPPGGFALFLVNTVLIVLLSTCSFWGIWLLLYLYLYAPAPYIVMTVYCIAISILPLFFEIYLIYSTIKNRKLRDTDPNNLYKDNKRLPFAAAFQIFSFVTIFLIIFLAFIFYKGLIFNNPGLLEEINWELDLNIADVISSLFMGFIVSCILIIYFYIEDILRHMRKKDLVWSKIGGIRNFRFLITGIGVLFIIVVGFIILSLTTPTTWGPAILHLTVFAFVVWLIISILVIFVIKYGTKYDKSPNQHHQRSSKK